MADYDVIIVGGGAAGLACAVSLLRGSEALKVCIVDAGNRFGKKLAASGNGQGNISNTDMTAVHYHGGNVALVEKIACSDAYAGTKLFDCLFVCDESGRIYPAGKQASALTDNLLGTLKRLGISNMSSGVKVTEIKRSEAGFSVFYDNSDNHDSAKFVVLCTGGKAQKQFKTDGSSYSLATAFGHTLTPLYPSLVQLKTDVTHIKTLKGIRSDCILSVVCGEKTLKKSRGDIIFTDYGVSGNAVFSVSSVTADKPSATLSIEFLPDVPSEEIEQNIGMRKSLGYETDGLLSGTLHNQIGRAVIKRAASSSPREIVKVLKNFTLEVKGTLGFDYAQVTKGGVDMREITGELESKFVENLFFAGEILDADGDCGGYNLQWAFTSGAAVAGAVLKRL